MSPIEKEQFSLVSQSEMWDRLAYVNDREREIACRAYLDLIACRETENVESALKLHLGSAMLIEVPYILELVWDVQGRKVLDAGCGGGFYSICLGEQGAKVLGIDSSKEMVKIAREKASAKKLDAEFTIGDVSDLKIEDGEFDIVLSALVLMEVKELDKAVGELVRVTRNEGDAIVSVQHPVLTARDWESESGEKIFRKLDHYFTERELTAVWENEKKERLSFKYYHRPLQCYTEPFLRRGCVLVRLVEPYPHEAYKALNPEEYEDTKRIPHFVIFKFRKTASRFPRS